MRLIEMGMVEVDLADELDRHCYRLVELPYVVAVGIDSFALHMPIVQRIVPVPELELALLELLVACSMLQLVAVVAHRALATCCWEI